MEQFTGKPRAPGGLVTFKDSNWLMSVVLAHQPHFAGQPEGVQVFWGYACIPTASATSSPSPWRSAAAKKSCASCAAT
jgi:myosin-crossreactive antigen